MYATLGPQARQRLTQAGGLAQPQTGGGVARAPGGRAAGDALGESRHVPSERWPTNLSRRQDYFRRDKKRWAQDGKDDVSWSENMRLSPYSQPLSGL